MVQVCHLVKLQPKISKDFARDFVLRQSIIAADSVSIGTPCMPRLSSVSVFHGQNQICQVVDLSFQNLFCFCSQCFFCCRLYTAQNSSDQRIPFLSYKKSCGALGRRSLKVISFHFHFHLFIQIKGYKRN